MWRDAVLRFFRVPPTPEPPPGSPPRVFRAADNYLTLRRIGWTIGQITAAIGLGVATGFLFAAQERIPSKFLTIFEIGEVLAWIGFILQLPFSWAVLHLDFEQRWYMVSDRAIRIREGVTTVREKTVALANIQNIAIRQGPLQRLLGIADVEVKTAGGGAGTNPHGKENPFVEPMHVAYFRGVDNAEEIRDLVGEGVRRQRDSGLGDHDETPDDDDVRGAVTLLLEEARALRAVTSR